MLKKGRISTAVRIPYLGLSNTESLMKLYSDSVAHQTETVSIRNQTEFRLSSYCVGCDAGRVGGSHIVLLPHFTFFSHFYEHNYIVLVKRN